MVCEKTMQTLSELAQSNAFIFLSRLKVCKAKEVLLFHIIIFPALLEGKKKICFLLLAHSNTPFYFVTFWTRVWRLFFV